MVCLGLTCRWCHTCQSVGDCSFPSAFAASWSSPQVGCPQSADACSPGKLWRGSYTPGCSIQQGNLHKRGHQSVNQTPRKPLWTGLNNAGSCMCCSYHRRRGDFLWLQKMGDWREQKFRHLPPRRQSNVLVWRPASQSATDHHSELNLRSHEGSEWNFTYWSLWGNSLWLCLVSLDGPNPNPHSCSCWVTKSTSLSCEFLNVEWTLIRFTWAQTWGEEIKI